MLSGPGGAWSQAHAGTSDPASSLGPACFVLNLILSHMGQQALWGDRWWSVSCGLGGICTQFWSVASSSQQPALHNPHSSSTSTPFPPKQLRAGGVSPETWRSSSWGLCCALLDVELRPSRASTP